MDDKGFIFTADASLALIVIMLLTTTIVSSIYYPIYMGQDHQHLESLADSALAVMEQDGTINNAAVESARGNNTGAQQILNDRLHTLIPDDTAYQMTISLNQSNVVNATDDKGISVSKDTVTKVRVESAPQEGWMGRAWYKIENFTFVNQTQNVTTTFWNFHNWLTNFNPWNTNNGLRSYPNWGSGSNPGNITFPVPSGTIYNTMFLIGCDNKNNGSAFGASVSVNGVPIIVSPNQPTFLNYRPVNNPPTERMYNYQGIIPNLNPGVLNNYTVKFQNMSSSQTYDLPWFSIIGNYSTTYPVPQGLLTSTFQFPNAAGLAVQDPQNFTGNGPKTEYGRIYDLSTGAVNSFYTKRVVTWDNFINQNSTYSDGVPFVITNAHGASGTSVTATKTAVSVVQDVNIPAGNTIFDAFTVVNAYGGVDGALVEVWDGSQWRTVFCSFNLAGQSFTQTDDGYGNIPGIIYLGDQQGLPYLQQGVTNKVRVTVWDDVPGSDYDLVGLVNCYTTVAYSALNVKWVNTPFDSYQSSSNTRTQTESFDIGENAKRVLLFVGVGTDSRNIKVQYDSSHVLYQGSIPYYIDLASLDASKGFHVITTANSTGDLYTLKQGVKYNLTVTVTGPANAWESGDTNANAEIFSGTRIAVLYPETLRNMWTISFNSTASAAEQTARARLMAAINVSDPSQIKTEALYTGNLPNQIPVRLSLWDQ